MEEFLLTPHKLTNNAAPVISTNRDGRGNICGAIPIFDPHGRKRIGLSKS